MNAVDHVSEVVTAKIRYNVNLREIKVTKCVYKLCSTHKLAIEQGRHLNEPRENTLCQICNYNELEDKYHFVLVCPILSDVRRNVLPLWCNNNPGERKLINLFQTDNFNILKNLALYIKKANCIREEMLSLWKVYSSYFVYQW